MSRSLKKAPFIGVSLYEKVLKAIELTAKGDPRGKIPIKTHERRSSIVDQMVGYTFLVHNGNKYPPVHISEEMIGHKLGEFSPTKKFVQHRGEKARMEQKKKKG